MKTTYDIIIADDYPIFRKGLREIIEAHHLDYAVTSEAKSGIIE